MQEFSSISVSSYEAGSLADQLTGQSKDGWEVVAIIPTGSTVTAYLSRDADASADGGENATDTAAAAVAVGAVDATPDVAPATEPGQAAPIDEPAGWGAAPDDATTTPEPAAAAAAPDATPAADTSAAAADAAAAPAGWYADPSSRYELRYWDGSQWTQHVSRAGQQYTDPPVA